jgi:nucleotide-binding universal stress UspA family protein
MRGSGIDMKDSGLAGFRLCVPLEPCRPTERLRQIIVPVDLTNDCATSIGFAVCFAKIFGSTVNLLHFYQEPYVVNHLSRSRDCDLFSEHRRKVFDDFCNLLRKTRRKYPASIGYFEYGNAYREIGIVARQLHADLLIVSMHSGKWFEHLLFGRHADSILASAPCPVLFIREGKTDLTERITFSASRPSRRG